MTSRFRFWSLAGILVCCAVAAQADEIDVRKDLSGYYQDGGFPSMIEAMKNLVGEQIEARADAQKYVIAVLKQTQSDESSGTGWRALPYFGSNGESRARKVRQIVAKRMAEVSITPATVAIIRWYLDQERDAELQAMVLPALDRMTGPEADELCLGLLQPVHENFAVAVAAVKQIGKRNIAIPDVVLKSLCDHHRKSLRDAARTVIKERGEADPGAFDPLKAMQSPAICKVMTEIGTLLDRPAPADAECVLVTTKQTYEMKTSGSTSFGWLLKNDGNTWEIYTPFGRRELFNGDQRVTEWQIVGNSTTSAWQKYDIAREVARVVELRAQGDRQYELSHVEKGQNQGSIAGIYEATLAHWLYSTKQFDLAGQILLPSLETANTDRHLVEVVRHLVGQDVGYQMLIAFAGDRDFQEAERLANTIVERYPETLFHGLARRLVKELPRRRDDFKTFTLPTADEWTRLKTTLNRTEQVGYLTVRMRLLNCFQSSQPGGYGITDTQFAEPSGMSTGASWGLGRGKTGVINPYVEFVGTSQRRFFDDDEQTIGGLNLTVADVPQLASFLRDDWHLLCVSYWRDFHPARNVGTTREYLGYVINVAAATNLCAPNSLSGMSAAEIDLEIDRIVRWVRDNGHKTQEQLIWERLDEEVKADTSWGRLSDFSRLIEIKDPRLLPILNRYVSRVESDYERHCLLNACRRFDPVAFKDEARKYIAEKQSNYLRVPAARLLFAAGERATACEALGQILAKNTPSDLSDSDLPKLVEPMLKENSEGSRQSARVVFKTRPYAEIGGAVRVALTRQFAAAKIGDGYLNYLPLLDIQGHKLSERYSVSEDMTVAEFIAKEITDQLAPDDPGIVSIKRKFPNAADQVAPLKEWLKSKSASLDSK